MTLRRSSYLPRSLTLVIAAVVPAFLAFLVPSIATNVTVYCCYRITNVPAGCAHEVGGRVVVTCSQPCASSADVAATIVNINDKCAGLAVEPVSDLCVVNCN
jgi:hypothetical protein